MANVHYFQRYSQKENVVTNNTLLLLSRLYQHSPALYEDVLNSLLDDINLTVEPTFLQQKGSRSGSKRGSIPDGVIAQASYQLILETKRHGNPSADQIKRHLDRFDQGERQVLLLLDKKKPAPSIVDDVNGEIEKRTAKRGGKAVFKSATFEGLIDVLRDMVPEYELRMQDIIDDYEAFCVGENLIPEAPHKMRVVPVGQSFHHNVEFDVYYHPSDRGHSHLGYIGLYKSKSVRAVGHVQNWVHAMVDDEGEVTITEGEATDDEVERIRGAVAKGMEELGYNFPTEHKYFLVDSFYRTDEGDSKGFNKTSKYGLPGEKHFNLKDVLGVHSLPETPELAQRLAQESWQ